MLFNFSHEVTARAEDAKDYTLKIFIGTRADRLSGKCELSTQNVKCLTHHWQEEYIQVN